MKIQTKFIPVLIALISFTGIISIQGQSSNNEGIELRESCLYENVLTMFVLVTDKTDNKWHLVEQFTKTATQVGFEEKGAEKVIIFFFNNSKMLPPQKPNSQKHVESIGKKILTMRSLNPYLIGFVEAKEPTSDFLKYPIEFLYQSAWESANSEE
jgi:hypothetical protein